MDPGFSIALGEFCSTYLLTACMELGDVSSLYTVGLGLTLSKTAVFTGVVAAQIVTSALSVMFGAAILSESEVILAASAGVFALFALWSFYQAYTCDTPTGEELIEPLLEQTECVEEAQWLSACWKSFLGTAISELGSKSQVVTCALSTKFRPEVVFAAAIAGVCTTLGVLLYASQGLAKVCTPRKAYVVSGVLFLACAVASLTES